MAEEEAKKQGCLGIILWASASVVVTVLGGIYLTVVASGSESAGVHATYIVAPAVLGFWTATLVALVLRFVKVRSGTIRAGAPLGCGCLTAVLVGVLTMVFFSVIWPAL
jgi:hypothetical protein